MLSSRLIVGKADRWYAEFGQRQVVVAAVIAGVYDLPTLRDAQEHNVALFWQHDLRKLIDFVNAAA